MVRPKNRRRVDSIPSVTYFKPTGIPLRTLEEVVLSVDEAEALRLKDIEGLEQEQCGEKMNVSRPTFHRVLTAARKKVADALMGGKAIRIEGGSFKLAAEGDILMTTRKQAEGLGEGSRMKGAQTGAGPVGNCVCPNCGTKTPHQRGIPCYETGCPNCGNKMTRDQQKIRIRSQDENRDCHDDKKTISPHFGRAPLYVVVTTENGKTKKREIRSKTGHHTFGDNPKRDCGHGEGHGFDAGAGKRHRSMIDAIADCHVLIAGVMGHGAFMAMQERNITPLITEIEDIDEAVNTYMEGNLANRTELLH